MRAKNSVASGVALLGGFFITNLCCAYLIDSAALFPVSPTTTTPISLNVSMTTPGIPAFLAAPSTTQFNGNLISINVYPDSGALTAIGSLSEAVPFGLLSSGTYNYEVTLIPPTDIPFGRNMRFASGTFIVVPEPATIAVLLLAVMLVGGIHRRARALT